MEMYAYSRMQPTSFQTEDSSCSLIIHLSLFGVDFKNERCTSSWKIKTIKTSAGIGLLPMRISNRSWISFFSFLSEKISDFEVGKKMVDTSIRPLFLVKKQLLLFHESDICTNYTLDPVISKFAQIQLSTERECANTNLGTIGTNSSFALA